MKLQEQISGNYQFFLQEHLKSDLQLHSGRLMYRLLLTICYKYIHGQVEMFQTDKVRKM